VSSEELLGALALVEAEDFDAGVAALRELVPDLDGRELLDALLALGRASMWTEHTDEALACAERSIEIADAAGDLEMRAPALALLSQVLGQRGLDGDLDRALELGDRALDAWVPGARAADLAQHESLHGLAHYWVGRYPEAADLCHRGGDGATEALVLAALGRPEDAIELGDAAIASARDGGSPIFTAYALCCSTAALRDVLDLAEARRRNDEGIELFRSVGFESGVMQGEMDLLYADLVADDVGSADGAWPGLWARLPDASGWERWLAPGRLSVAHAEIVAKQERWEAAVDAALEAIEVARRIGRVKYDVSARIVLGTAQLELGKLPDAAAELRTAAADADRLGHPPTRWRAHAALGRALDAAGDDDGAAAASRGAAEIARDFVATLNPEHADRVFASAELQEILRA
jgi:tetratricopeptide (TPR) repeat protein